MMLFSSKKNILDSKILKGFTDYHSHLLPGVDDGVQSLDESLTALCRLEELGVKTLFLTPHVMEEIPNKSTDLANRFEHLKESYPGNIELHLAAEYMLDSHFETCMEQEKLLTFPGNRILVETSYVNPPFNLDQTLFALQAKGYQPVLAHAERFRYMQMQDYDRYKRHNVLFQLNLPSLAGAYGKTACLKAQELLKKGYYNLCGCDIHSLQHFEYALRQKCLTKAIISQLENIAG